MIEAEQTTTTMEVVIEVTRELKVNRVVETEFIGAVPLETGIYTTDEGRVIEVDISGLAKGVRKAKSLNIGVQGITGPYGTKDVFISRKTQEGAQTIGTGDRFVVQLAERDVTRRRSGMA